MNRAYVKPGFFVLMAGGALGAAVASHSLTGILCVLLLIPTGAILFAARTWQGRIFYLVCSGELLVIACGAVSIWAGLFTAWMLTGIVLGELRMIEGNEDMGIYLLFCCVTLVPAAVIQVSNHVLLPLLLLAAGAGLVLFYEHIRNYQLRKTYTGGVS
jgi:hypothetical protein